MLHTDSEIVGLVRKGDRKVFSSLYLQYHKRLVEFAFTYTRSVPIAQEIVQDVFLELWERRDSWSVRQSISAYLFGAVRNRAVSFLRHEKASDRLEARLSNETGRADSGGQLVPPEAQLDNTEHLRELVAAVARLPEMTRTIIALRWGQDLTYKEIAAVVGSTEEAVRKQIARALSRLNSLLTSPK